MWQHLGVCVSFLLIAVALGVFQEDAKYRKTCIRGRGCVKQQVPSTDDVELGRIPEDLWPYHYNIEIQTEIDRESPPFPFQGKVEVFMDCLASTDVVYLNSRDLDVDADSLEIEVTEDSPVYPDPPQWTSFVTDDELQFVIIQLEAPLAEGARYVVRMEYSGQLTLARTGYYWDSYEMDGQTRYLSATQFQSFHTRAALPCFDEPAFKATFDVTLVRPEGWVALSNMPIISQEQREDGWVADTYDTTPVMSSYLLCFVISDYEYVETVTPRGHVVRIWARSDRLYAAEFALQTAADMQEWFEDYTGVDYPLPKQDHIALPNKSGAMENWGLITYGEWYLLWDPEWSNTNYKRYVATIISHELAHQWFGNYVTCVWWNNTWLNEGFASFFEYRSLDDTVGWHGGEIRLIHSTQSIMNSDASNTSLPVRVDVDSPWQAGSSFTSYTYSKGGSMVLMLMQVMGEDSFRRGLHRYLTDNAYGSVATDDLWDAMTTQAAEDGVTDTDGSPLDIKEKFDPWVEQSGVPLVTVLQDSDGVANAYQTRFLNPPDQEINTPSPWDYKWNIPLTFSSEDDTDWNRDTRVWLDRDDVTLTEDIPSLNEWLSVNVESLGYYLTNYDEGNRAALAQQLSLDPQVLSRENRATLLYDTSRLAIAGYHNDVVIFEFTQGLGQDIDYAPWHTTETVLDYPALMLSRYPETYPKMASYMRSLLDPVYEELGWYPDGDEPFERMALRVRILWMTCAYSNSDCVQESSALYDQWKQDIDDNPVPSDHHLTVYCTAIREGTEEDFDHAHTAYLNTFTSNHPFESTERNYLLAAMACPWAGSELLQKYFDMTFDPDQIRTADAQRALTDIASSDYGGRQFMWEYLQDNWRDPYIFPDGVAKNTIFLTTVEVFCTDSDLAELDEFLATYPAEGPVEQAAYDEALTRAQENSEWAQVNQQELDDWLDAHAPTVTAQYDTTRMRSHSGHHLLSLVESQDELQFPSP